MKVGITGTQQGMNARQRQLLHMALHDLVATELHHGDCLGVDAQAHLIARELGLFIVTHPPGNMSKRAHCIGDEVRTPKPYLERNHDIVDEVEYLIAIPKGNTEELRSGTWATVRYARRIGRKHYIIFPGENV
jgi:hypothetical protein